MLRKFACLLPLSVIAIYAAADLGIGRMDSRFAPSDCPQGMAQPKHRSDGDLYGTISAIEGPQTRQIFSLGLDIPRCIRHTDPVSGFVYCSISLAPASYSPSTLTPLRI